MSTMRVTSLLTAALLVGSLSPAAAGTNEDDALRRAISSTVRILTGSFTADGQFRGQTSGSGVMISSRGQILTNHHVVFAEDSKKPYPEVWAGLVDERLGFSPPSRAVRLKLMAWDEKLDLALLEIVPRKGEKAEGYPFVPLGSTAELFYGSHLRIAGFPAAGGPTTTVAETTVLGIDEDAGWIKVDGGVMRGVSGGAALNQRGELAGIPTMVRADQEVPFLGDSNVPMGTIVLGTVGYVRSVEAVRLFLRGAADGQLADNAGQEETTLVQVKGVVLDKSSKKAIPGAVVGLLAPLASADPGEIEANDLLAYGRSDFNGAFSVNRACRPGDYLVKIVHPQYRTLVRRVTVDSENADFEVTLKKE